MRLDVSPVSVFTDDYIKLNNQFYQLSTILPDVDFVNSDWLKDFLYNKVYNNEYWQLKETKFHLYDPEMDTSIVDTIDETYPVYIKNTTEKEIETPLGKWKVVGYVYDIEYDFGGLWIRETGKLRQLFPTKGDLYIDTNVVDDLMLKLIKNHTVIGVNIVENINLKIKTLSDYDVWKQRNKVRPYTVAIKI